MDINVSPSVYVCVFVCVCACCYQSDLSAWLVHVMSIVGCKRHINYSTLTHHKPWTWCFDLHPRAKTKRQKWSSGKGLFNGNRKKINDHMFWNTNTSLSLAWFAFALQFAYADILSESYTYVENVHVIVHATAVKNMTSFLQAVSCFCLNPGQ